MSDVAITVENISKLYHIGSKRSGSLRETLAHAFGRKSKEEIASEEFWALKDVSFEIKRGEAVGIIGKNGAGKSTLLKVLSRITEPTKGRIEINGRVASLLEVGTGFHPELTGRENIFMNGTILGMTRREIKAKFDEIVDFSGVEKFIDTPVKHYSSGMYVRLAFAVAAHLEPEILIIDEVLAVGDAEFQKKCLGKMGEVAGQGRTVIFVSHNFAAIKAFCTSTILLEAGAKSYQGDVQKGLDKYSQGMVTVSREFFLLNINRKNFANDLMFEHIKFERMPIPFGEPIIFELKLHSTNNKQVFDNIEFGVAIVDRNNNTLIHCSNLFIHQKISHYDDKNIYSFKIANILKADIYSLTLFLRCNGLVQDWLMEVIRFEIEDGNPYQFTDTSLIHGSILPSFSLNVVN